jgi:hypothetical protein
LISQQVAALVKDAKPFFGPVRRVDGLCQFYVELPYHHYLEIDLATYAPVGGLPAARAWADAVACAGSIMEDEADDAACSSSSSSSSSSSDEDDAPETSA